MLMCGFMGMKEKCSSNFDENNVVHHAKENYSHKDGLTAGNANEIHGVDA